MHRDPTYDRAAGYFEHRANQRARQIFRAFPSPEDYRRFVYRLWPSDEARQDMIARVEREQDRAQRRHR